MAVILHMVYVVTQGIKATDRAVVLEEHPWALVNHNIANLLFSSPISHFFLQLCHENKMCPDEFIEENKSHNIDAGPHQSTACGTSHPEQVEVIVEAQEAPSE